MLVVVSIRISRAQFLPRGMLADSIEQCLPSVMMGAQQPI
jgi:hypothetical protein